MTQWPRMRLQEFCDFSSGGKLKLTKRAYVDSGYPAFSAAGQDGCVAQFEFDRPGVVVSAIGARCGKAFLALGKWTTLANTYCVLPDTSVCDPEFLWFQLNDENSWMKSGSAQPFIKPADIKARKVVIPPLPEQRRIVNILNRANGIHRLRREAQEKARQLIPALFVEMFGDPGSNPRGWSIAALGDLGQLDRGKSKHRPRNDARLLHGPYPFIQTGDVANSGGIIRSYTATYSEFGLAQSRMWPAGTLCITIAANIASTGVLTFDACFPDSVVAFVPGSDVTVSYIQAALNFLQPILEAQATQMAQKNINLAILRALKIPRPPLDLQQAFAERVADIKALIVQQERMAEASEDLMASLMARAFDDEIASAA